LQYHQHKPSQKEARALAQISIGASTQFSPTYQNSSKNM
jgi:hypothetical protein